MRVGVFYSGHAPDAGGGYSFETEILHSLIEAVRRTNHHFTVICPDGADANVVRVIADSGMALARFPKPGRVERIAESLLRGSALLRSKWPRPSRLDRIVREFKLDLVWLLGPGTQFVDAPYITTVWDVQHRITPWFPEFSRHGVWDSRELATAWFLQRATRVITGTKVGKEEIETAYGVPSANIAVLPHPTPGIADIASAADSTSVLERFSLTKPYLFYPAQFWPHKNHINLLLALKILGDSYNLRPMLCLSGSDKGNESHLRSIARDLGILAQVRFVGFVAVPDLIGLYRAADALCYVSFCGPENLPPLEAMVLGCPVVASEIPGAQEQLGSAALLVDPARPTSIAEGIYRLFAEDGLRENLRSKGFERARSWRGADFVNGVIRIIDEFEPVRRCWR